MLRQLHLCNLGLEEDSTSLDSDTVFSCMVHLDFSWHVVYQVVVIIKPLQRWLRHNQSLTFYSWGTDVTVTFPKQLSLSLLPLSFSGFISSVHLCLESSEPHLTQVWEGSQVWMLPASPRLELKTGKCCATFGLSGGDVLMCHHSGERGQKQDTHTHHLCCNMHKLCFLYAYHSQIISANGADWILYSVFDKTNVRWWYWWWWYCLFLTEYTFLSE